MPTRPAGPSAGRGVSRDTVMVVANGLAETDGSESIDIREQKRCQDEDERAGSD